MKDNALYEAVGEQDVPQKRHILKDELIQFTGLQAEEKCADPLRRVEVYVPETEETLVFLTEQGVKNEEGHKRKPWEPEGKMQGAGSEGEMAISS